LPVAGTEAQDAEVTDDFRVKALEPNFQDGRLALLFDPLQDLLSGLGNDLFESSRMNPAVHDQLVQRDSGDLAADRVGSADDHGFRGVVDDQIDPGRLLKGPDVPALLADDAAFELVCRQRQHRDRNLGGLVGGDALNRLGDDLASTALALIASHQFGLPHLAGNLVAQVLLDLGHQDALGFLARHVGDALELALLLAIALFELCLDVVQRLLLVRELALAAIEVVGLAVEVFLFLEKALFELLRLNPILSGLLFGGRPDLDSLFLGLQELLLGRGFGVSDRLLSLELQVVTPVALAALEEEVNHPGADGEGQQCHRKEQNENVEKRHVTCTSLIRLSKCVTMAGLNSTEGPASGGLYDFAASGEARVTQILGFRSLRGPEPDQPACLSSDRRAEPAAEELWARR